MAHIVALPTCLFLLLFHFDFFHTLIKFVFVLNLKNEVRFHSTECWTLGSFPKSSNFFFFYANKAGCGTGLATRKEHLVALCSGLHAGSLARVADGGWLLADWLSSWKIKITSQILLFNQRRRPLYVDVTPPAFAQVLTLYLVSLR